MTLDRYLQTAITILVCILLFPDNIFLDCTTYADLRHIPTLKLMK